MREDGVKRAFSERQCEAAGDLEVNGGDPLLPPKNTSTFHHTGFNINAHDLTGSDGVSEADGHRAWAASAV
jgi:hypothetical protein